MSIYLGLDSSTQSVTATAVDIDDAHPDRRAILFERTFRYDETLPHYNTEHGVLRSADPRTVHAPPLMWSEALDRMLADLVRQTDVDWSRLRAISGSAQQHGSVYVNARAGQRLGTLDPSQPLADQLGDVFSRPTSPIWMDSSTTSQCAAIEAAVGGPRALARITGSRAFERFTGPQIRKFAEDEPAAYAATDRVHLVSSWLASLLRRIARRHRSRRRVRHEPHGPRLEAMVRRMPSVQRRRTLTRSCRPLPSPGRSSARCRRTGSSGTASRPRASSPGPATTPAALSAPGSFAQASSRSRSARATRSSAS